MKKLFLSFIAVLLMMSGCTKSNSETNTDDNSNIAEEELREEIKEIVQVEGLDSADAESSDIEIETEIQIEEGESDGGF